MRLYFALLLSLITLHAQGQDTAVHKTSMYLQHPVYLRNTYTATIAVGFIDYYRHDYTLPAAFKKGNTSGFSPFYAKIEYGIGDRVSLAATFGYDAFVYNFSQVTPGNNGPVSRYKHNNTRILSGGLTAYYHLGSVIHVARLDPFIGIGASINNIRYSAFPQGDSTLVKLEHTVTPVLKAGARYYITDAFSVYGDVGFDKQSIFSVGFSCRFFRK